MEKNNNIYEEFIEKYSNFAKDLYTQTISESKDFPKTQEHPLYNKGTMDRDTDVPVSSNIYLMSTTDFERRLSEKDISKDEVDRKAMVVFDFMKEKQSTFSYENNANDFLFKNDGKDVDRKSFYSMIYDKVIDNTCYFNRNIGDMQLISLPKNDRPLPKSASGLPDKYMEQVNEINKETPNKLPEVFLKRGLYHEATHVVMGTEDERKCDTFAMLKIIKEHPKEAELICNIYKFSRSKSSYTIKNIHDSRNNEDGGARTIKNGAMTYIMPNTYERLEFFAKNPELLNNIKTDSDLMKLTYEITKEPEFLSKDLEQFSEIIKKDKISINDLANSEIMKSCIAQSGAKNFTEYLSIDKELGNFLKEHGENLNNNQLAEKKTEPSAVERLTTARKKSVELGRTTLKPVKAPYSQEKNNISDLSSLTYNKPNKR